MGAAAPSLHNNTLLFVSQRRNLTLILLSRQRESGALESEADY